MNRNYRPPRQTPPTRNGLPEHYTPRVAGHARGPMIVSPVETRASEWRWRNCRTYVIRALDGHDYRAVQVYSDGLMLGYWAVELLGVPLPLSGWE